MRLIVDANIVLSAILGRRGKVGRAIQAGLDLVIPEPQLEEAARVLDRKLGIGATLAREQVGMTLVGVDVIGVASFESARDAALARLGPRGKPDWPVLAAALVLDADIWSDDRDFFGVGVAVWWRDTIHIAIAQAAAA